MLRSLGRGVEERAFYQRAVAAEEGGLSFAHCAPPRAPIRTSICNPYG
jgi:hypothetical protein